MSFNKVEQAIAATIPTSSMHYMKNTYTCMHYMKYRIAGIFRGVKFSWIWKILQVRGKNFVVTCTRALMSVARCIYGNCFVGKYFVGCFSTTKTTKIFPPEKYPLYGTSKRAVT